MKVLINKTHEIEVDEKFRDMFPMKGCKGVRCNNECPFYVDGFPGCKLNIEAALKNTVITKSDFTAEIVEDRIDFNKLNLKQTIYYKGIGNVITGLSVSPKGREIKLGLSDWIMFNANVQDLSLTPPSKKKVTKTVEVWASINRETGNKVFSDYDFENLMPRKCIKVKLSGNYDVEE